MQRFIYVRKNKIFIPICLSGKPDFFVGISYKEGVDKKAISRFIY